MEFQKKLSSIDEFHQILHHQSTKESNYRSLIDILKIVFLNLNKQNSNGHQIFNSYIGATNCK